MVCVDSTTWILFSTHQQKFSNGFSEVDGMFKKIGDCMIDCLNAWLVGSLIMLVQYSHFFFNFKFFIFKRNGWFRFLKGPFDLLSESFDVRAINGVRKFSKHGWRSCRRRFTIFWSRLWWARSERSGECSII